MNNTKHRSLPLKNKTIKTTAEGFNYDVLRTLTPEQVSAIVALLLNGNISEMVLGPVLLGAYAPEEEKGLDPERLTRLAAAASIIYASDLCAANIPFLSRPNHR